MHEVSQLSFIFSKKVLICMVHIMSINIHKYMIISFHCYSAVSHGQIMTHTQAIMNDH